MPTCPKCGNKVTEDMSFCPKCGAALKFEQTAAPPPPPPPPSTTYRRRNEKGEKEEKEEKQEKGEKHEKRGYGFLGPLIGGLILIFIGLVGYLQITLSVPQGIVNAFVLVVIGIIIIIAAIYAAAMATRRHPRP